MRIRVFRSATLALLAVSIGSLHAQPGIQPAPAPANPSQTESIVVSAGEQSFDVLMAEPLEIGEPVVGKPFSAKTVTEVIQPLTDGNRIVRRATGMVARDSVGRFRREQQVVAIGSLLLGGDARIITITDARDGVHYSLDMKRSVALRAHPRVVRAKLAIENAGLVGPEGEPPMPRRDHLGKREIEGIAVEGVRTTFTLPVGAVGNERDIEIITERWFSPELSITILLKRVDPRLGETVYRLVDVTRAEPSPELFEVPRGYTVRDVDGSNGPGRHD